MNRKIKSFLSLVIIYVIIAMTAISPALAAEQPAASVKDEFVLIKKDTWNLKENSAHNDERTAKINRNNLQKAIDYYYARGYRKMRLEKMDIYIWGAEYKNYGKTGIIMRSGMHFDMNGSTFRLATNDRPYSYMILIGLHNSKGEMTTDVKLCNGTLIGDRKTHDYWQLVGGGGTKVSSHEWGTGINISHTAERAEVYNMVVKEITGDCIYMEGSGHIIRDCTISKGRRNGICSADTTTDVKIYRNTIYDIYNDVKIPQLTHNRSTLTQYQKDNGVTYGIGAEACIAYESPKGTISNIEIFENHLAGNSSSPYTQGLTLAVHSGAAGIYFHDNLVDGDINFLWGGHMIIERNKIFNGGISTDGRSATYNGGMMGTDGKRIAEGHPEYKSGKNAHRNYIINGNYFYNSRIWMHSSGPTYPDYPGQEGATNFAIIGNHFVNSHVSVFNIPTAFVGNVFNATNPREHAISIFAKGAPVNVKHDFLYAFVNNKVQFRKAPNVNNNTGLKNGWLVRTDAGYRLTRHLVYIYKDYGKIINENREVEIITPAKARAYKWAWYSETDDIKRVNEFLKTFEKINGNIDVQLYSERYNEIMDNLDYWYNLQTKKIKDGDTTYTPDEPWSRPYQPPYTLRGQLKRYYEKVGRVNPVK